MPNMVEDTAIKIVTEYFQTLGYDINNVSKGKRPESEHRGYDLIARKAGETIKIEVKGCTRRWGIPDPYETEFDSEKRLVADLLCIAYIFGSETQLCVIPREAIKPEDIVPRKGYRFRSHFKNEKSLSQYLRELRTDV
jgi:Protein NO VEIN, C-terminal